MRGTIYDLALALATAVAVLAATLVFAVIITAHAGPRSCTFDGGGTIASGTMARTTDNGYWWSCQDGRLYRLT